MTMQEHKGKKEKQRDTRLSVYLIILCWMFLGLSQYLNHPIRAVPVFRHANCDI